MINLTKFALFGLTLLAPAIQASTVDLTTGVTNGSGLVNITPNNAVIYATTSLIIDVSELKSFEYNFISHDRLNDWFAISFNGGDELTLTDVNSVVDYGSTGWLTHTLLQPITGTIKFSIYNARDDEFDSQVSLRNLYVNDKPVATIPVPGTFWLITSGLFMMISRSSKSRRI